MGITKWNGDEITKKYAEAAKRGINKTMSECVLQAKQNHPGWKNRTGMAEGSVRIIQFAQEEGKQLVGRWGSNSVNYVVWLELNHGAFLRTAADLLYPKLTENIKSGLA